MNNIPSQKSVTIKKVTWVGLFLNLLLSAVKFLAGIFGHSQVLVADAIHSLSDMITDFAILIGASIWTKPPDENHPYGHNRIETFVTLFIGAFLFAVSFGIGQHAVESIRHYQESSPTFIALIAALISIVVKEFLYQWTHSVGKKIKSSSLVANAWHHRSDAISSLPAVLAVGGSMLFPGIRYLDQIGAIIVAIFIGYSAVKIMWPSIRELTDTGAHKDIQKRIIACSNEIPEIIQIHKIRTRYLGSDLFLDLHVVVDGGMTIDEGHRISHQYSDLLKDRIPDISDVSVHIEPHHVLKK